MRRALRTNGGARGSLRIRAVNGLRRGDSERLSQRRGETVEGIESRQDTGSTGSTGASGREKRVVRARGVIQATTRVPETALAPETREKGYLRL